MKTSTTIVLLMAFVCRQAVAQTASGVVNSYYSVLAVSTATNSLTVDNSAGLVSGEQVLLFQAKGAAIDGSNTATFGNITFLNSAGNYEFNTICSVNGNDVVLKATLLNSYNPLDLVQLVGIPSYGSVVVSGTVNSTPWNPLTGKGGIVVLAATDTLFLNANIDVRGQGFLGGALVNFPIPPFNCEFFIAVDSFYMPLLLSGFYTGGLKGEGVADYILSAEYGRGKLANGGGGGNNNNTGGAGGGNYGAGGAGGQRAGESQFDCQGAYPGIGGASLAPYGYSTGANRIFFGGGGGSGHENNGVGLPGGNGGGIIILSAPVIVGGGGQLLASGVAPLNAGNTDPTQAEGDGGGGGGAGGTVVLNAATLIGSIVAQAAGANGSDASNGVDDCTGPGGGGGGGVVWMAGPAPIAFSATVTGGPNGVVSAGNTKAACRGLANGATGGAAGAVLSGYTAPASNVNTCIPLATTPLKYFDGYPSGKGFSLSWGLYSPEAAAGIRSYTLRRSVNQGPFNPVVTVAGSPDSIAFHYNDTTGNTGTVYYQLTGTNNDGSVFYSSVLVFSQPLDPAIDEIRLQPNPVSDRLTVELFSRGEEKGFLRLFTAQGQVLASYPATLRVGTTSLVVPVGSLSDGTYFLVVETNGRREVRPFIKRRL